MHLYLIRHTAPLIEKGICYGQSDVGLADSFESECDILFPKLPQTVDLIYYSPLKRCHLLAEKLVQHFKLSAATADQRLKELNFGRWEMQAWDQIESQKLDQWMNNFVDQATDGGESFVQLQTRVVQFYVEMLAPFEESDLSVVVVAHAGPIRSLLCHLQQIDLKNAFEIKVDYGSITTIKVGNHQITVDFTNP